MRSFTVRCRILLLVATSFTVVGQVTNGQTDSGSPSAAETLQELQSDLSADSGREKRWSEFLQFAELKPALESQRPTDEVLNAAISALQSVQHAPSPLRLQQLTEELAQFSEKPEDTTGILARLREFRQHLTTLGERGKGWQQVLPVDQLEGLVTAEDKSSSSWRDQFAAARDIVQAEARVQDRARFEQLRRALLNALASRDHRLFDGMAQRIRAAKHEYRAATQAQLDNARRRLDGSMASLDAFLSRGSRENADRWKKFLQWDELREIRDPTASPRLSKLARVFQKFQSGEDGLQLPVFRQVTTDLERYLEYLNSYDSQPNRLATAKSELEAAQADLDRFLQTAPKPREEAWKEFLSWDALQRLLQQDSRDVRAYAQVLRQYESGSSGLELSPFRRVATHLAKYTELIALQQRAPAIDQFDARVEQLARALQGQVQQSTVAQLASLQENLNWLEMTDRLPDVRQQLKDRFGEPNFGVRVSSELVGRALSNTASRITPVGLCFCGSWVSGSSRSNVAYQAHLLPSAHSAMVEIQVAGTSFSQTVARQRRVSVYAHGHTLLTATKQLIWDGRLIDDTPACADASTRQQICGASVDRLVGQRLIGRFALRKANRLRPCAEQVSDCQARTQLAEQMDRQAVDMLRKANQRLQDLEGTLREQRLYPDTLHVSSSTEAMFLQAKLLCSGMLAATGPPPAVPEASDVLVQVHESVVNNLMADRIRGVKVDNETIVDRMKQMGLSVPPELAGAAAGNRDSSPSDGAAIPLNPPANQPAPTGQDAQGNEDEPWSMQFDRTQPIAVEFRNGTINITVRGFNFTRGDQQINETIELTATYQFVFSPQRGLRVRRTGEVDIRFVGAGDRLTTRQITYKTFLARKMNALFRQEMSLDDLPAGELRDRVKSIPPRLVYAREGWLSLGVNVSDEILKDLGIGT